MALQVVNQQHVELKPFYTDDISVPLDGAKVHEYIKEIFKPVWTSKNPKYPVEITDINNNSLDEDFIADRFMDCLGEKINTDAEEDINSMWKQSLSFFKSGLTAKEVFTAQAFAIKKYPENRLPGPAVIYTSTDMKNACRDYLADGRIDDSGIIANASFYLNEPCVMFHFLNRNTFNDFKEYVKQVANMLNSKISAGTARKFAEFDRMNLNTIEGLVLRKKDGDEFEEYSFSRILLRAAIDFARINDDCGIIAPYIDELIAPRNIVFLDIERISKTLADDLTRLFSKVRKEISPKNKPLSLKKISELSTAIEGKRVSGNQQPMQPMNGSQGIAKRRNFRFRKIAMTKTDLSNVITAIVKKETNVAASENFSKDIKKSFLKPNRRQPEDYNAQGKKISMTYKPDIHIYLDTSGSISDDNYREAVLTLITLAKKLDVNMYFNSFSSEISQSAKLQIRGKSIKGIYREIQSIPKVTGGTDFSKVWDYIMSSSKRKKEISLLITDFEYTPPCMWVDYPTKLYYIPISISTYYWNYMKNTAEAFCKNMYHIDKNIRRHILMK